MKSKLQKFMRSDWAFVLGVFLVWRMGLLVVGFFATSQLASPNSALIDMDYGYFLNMWSNWDGWHYIKRSLIGYAQNEPFTAFFPLYPLLIFLVSKLLFLPVALAALIVSNVSIIFAGYFLMKLVRLDYSEAVARGSYILLLTFPTAFFLGAAYTESLFLLLTISAFYFARTKRWFWAGVVAYFAALTRNLGVFLMFPLLYEYWRQFGLKFNWKLLACLMPGFGLSSYMLYLLLAFGDPLKFVADQSAWGREIRLNIFANIWDNFLQVFYFTHHHDPWPLVQFGLASLMIGVVIAGWKKIRKSYLIWMILLLLPGLLQNVWTSVNRYVLVLFPAFIFFALLFEKRRYGQIAWVYLGTLLMAWHLTLYVNAIWAG